MILASSIFVWLILANQIDSKFVCQDHFQDQAANIFCENALLCRNPRLFVKLRGETINCVKQLKNGTRNLLERSAKMELFKCKRRVAKDICPIIRRMPPNDQDAYIRCFHKIQDFVDKRASRYSPIKMCQVETELDHYSLYKPTYYFCTNSSVLGCKGDKFQQTYKIIKKCFADNENSVKALAKLDQMPSKEEFCTRKMRSIMLMGHEMMSPGFQNVVKCLSKHRQHLNKFDPYDNKFKC